MLSRPDDFDKRLVKAMPMLRRIAFTLCRNRDTADDLVQETMLRALANRASFVPGTNFEAWLVTIQRNFFFTGMRKLRREVADVDGVIAGKVPLEDNPVRKIEAAEMLDLVGKLPQHFSAPLRLIADGATYEEIATELREHVGTIKSRVNRGRNLLKSAE